MSNEERSEASALNAPEADLRQTSNAFPLLQLPTEIRLLILQRLFEGSVIKTRSNAQIQSCPGAKFALDLELCHGSPASILFVNRQLYSEGRQMYWERVTVDLRRLTEPESLKFSQQKNWNQNLSLRNLRLGTINSHFICADQRVCRNPTDATCRKITCDADRYQEGPRALQWGLRHLFKAWLKVAPEVETLVLLISRFAVGLNNHALSLPDDYRPKTILVEDVKALVEQQRNEEPWRLPESQLVSVTQLPLKPLPIPLRFSAGVSVPHILVELKRKPFSSDGNTE